ncbi:COP9 signalosome complex subunit 3 isoform X1 [Drosophila guanche]|uniref:COP9 signalosome complex subunit 3 n=1 Tax=Drosophila guanche TaxID=7266 RepID=A0A3B0K0I9_DROGU|nr:COP9 signalosome complex subunit 3 isoform X1 [Drosophila guanche]SPP76878.1 blast:COP9 signalosome complex subunit 3 [Drosophila guanche]
MGSALENFVNQVRTMSASGSFRELADDLPESVSLLARNWSILDNVLETLDVQQHTLGVLYVLLAKLHSAATANPEPVQIIQLMRDFVQRNNVEQLRFAICAFYETCHLFTDYLVQKNLSILGIKIMARAVDQIRQMDTQLTPIHADLCLLSLKAKNFNLVLAYLDTDITDISTAAAECKTQQQQQSQHTVDANNDAKYFLLFYYYGGMIYTAVKNYDRALYFFEVCITTPAMAMSHIMLEAYKKFLMVSLIVEGNIAFIPKNTQVIGRFMKPMASHYHDLVSVYANSSSEELRILILKYSEAFTRDSNMGLAKQVATSLYKRNIKRLTKTFLTLSLSDVASRVQLSGAAEAERYILNMIKSGEIYASINQKDGMVLFKDDPEKYNSPDMFLNVQTNITQVLDLVKQINKMEEEIILNPMYVKKALGSQDDDLTSQHPKTYSGDPTD